MSKEKFNSLDRLKLSEQALGCLKNAGINDLDRLSDIDIDLEKLNKVCFMKQNIVNEIVEKAGKIGIKFAPIVENEPLNLYPEDEDRDIAYFSINCYGCFPILEISYYKNGDTKYHYCLEGGSCSLDDDIFDIYIGVIDEYKINDRVWDLLPNFEKYLEEELKKFRGPKNEPNKELIIRRKLEDRLGYYDEKLADYEKSIEYDLEKFLTSDEFIEDLYNKIFEEHTKNYGKEQYEYKEIFKEKIRPVVSFAKDQIIKINAKQNKTELDKENVKKLEKWLQLWQKFPQEFMEFAGPDKTDEDIYKDLINDDILCFGDRKVWDISEEIAEKKYKEYDKNIVCDYKEVFNLIPKDYLQEEFYDKYNPMEEISLDKIPFIPNFIKTCKELSPEKNNSNYSKEVLAFLIDEYVSYMDDEDIYTEGTGRRGR